MTERALTVVGWRPTGPAITAIGIVMALAFGGVGLIDSHAVADMFARLPVGLVLSATVVILVGLSVARMVIGGRAIKRRPSMATIAIFVLTLANLMSVVTLLAAFGVAWLLGSGIAPSLLQALILSLMFSVPLSLAQVVAANVAAIRDGRLNSPPAV